MPLLWSFVRVHGRFLFLSAVVKSSRCWPCGLPYHGPTDGRRIQCTIQEQKEPDRRSSFAICREPLPGSRESRRQRRAISIRPTASLARCPFVIGSDGPIGTRTTIYANLGSEPGCMPVSFRVRIREWRPVERCDNAKTGTSRRQTRVCSRQRPMRSWAAAAAARTLGVART
jgi:hypothetical protein